MNTTRIATLIGLLALVGCDGDPMLYELAGTGTPDLGTLSPDTGAPDANPGLPLCTAPDGWALLVAVCPEFPGCRACLQAKEDQSSVGTVAGCWLPVEQARCAAHCSECF